jgi:hypothetical protein
MMMTTDFEVWDGPFAGLRVHIPTALLESRVELIVLSGEPEFALHEESEGCCVLRDSRAELLYHIDRANRQLVFQGHK